MAQDKNAQAMTSPLLDFMAKTITEPAATKQPQEDTTRHATPGTDAVTEALEISGLD